MKIKIMEMDHLGNGIGKIDNKVIFVPKSVPGDICDIDIYREYKKYSIGKINKILESSKLRIDSKCPYYDTCGGCNISNLEYSEQVNFKVNKVKNIFKKYLEIDINPRVIGSIQAYNYRNKITYHNDLCLGLVSEFDKIVDINKCMLVSDKINNLYGLIKKEDLSNVKKVTIREFDNGLVLDITGNIKIDNLINSCLAIYINGECKYKKDDGYICINSIKYVISYDAFFQINTKNISRLYDEIIYYGDFSKKDTVIDLYCGVGSISLYISKYVKSVLGIEIVDNAIRNAQFNAEINKIDNCKFICGNVTDLVDDNLSGNILIVDPPRIGLDKHTVSVINNKKIKKIIYVSCDPMTLVRDIKLLDNYQIKGISVVDMFPQTHHVESVVILEKIK